MDGVDGSCQQQVILGPLIFVTKARSTENLGVLSLSLKNMTPSFHLEPEFYFKFEYRKVEFQFEERSINALLMPWHTMTEIGVITLPIE